MDKYEKELNKKCRDRFGQPFLLDPEATLEDDAFKGELTTVEPKCPKCEKESLYKRHCKVVCSDCGVIKDCSDPF